MYCRHTLYSIPNYNFTFPLACVWAHTKYYMYIKYYREIFVIFMCTYRKQPGNKLLVNSKC